MLCANAMSFFLMWLQQNSIIRWKKQAEKKMEQFMVMDQWIKLKQEGKNLETYFLKNHYARIVIYGMNQIGMYLLRELKDSEIEVVYGIDRNAQNISSDIRIVTLKANINIPNIDAVVVTLAEEYDDISEALTGKLHCPVIAIEDILNEL